MAITKDPPHRIVWAFGLGYFLFYGPYSALIKIVTKRGLSGFELLPATIVGTVLAMPVVLTLLGWWKYAGIRMSGTIVLSGLGTAAIIGCTTLAYTFRGVSIIVALLMMRGGVLILAPLVDIMFRRHVRWFSVAALALSLGALALVFSHARTFDITLAALLNIALYLSGYVVRLPCMTRVAKSHDVEVTRHYFVRELLVAMVALVAVPAIIAFAGTGTTAAALRRGFTSFWLTPDVAPALAIGALYAGLYVFGTLIYLDRRENTFCIPLNRGSSLLAGVVASFVMARFGGFATPTGVELAAAGLILFALMLLSPFHHIFEYAFGYLAAEGRKRPV
jgi:hypothetical protein